MIGVYFLIGFLILGLFFFLITFADAVKLNKLRKKYNKDDDKSRKGGITEAREFRSIQPVDPSGGNSIPFQHGSIQPAAISNVPEPHRSTGTNSNSTRKNTGTLSKRFLRRARNK